MAEALGAVGSIIAIVQISKTIISLCRFYIDAVDGSSSDLRVILIEVSTLKAIAKSLQYLTQPNFANSALFNQLAAVTGPIEGCNKALKELEALFPPPAAPVNGQRSKRRKLDAAVAALAWPLKTGKAKKLLQEIIQHKTAINLALTTEFVRDLKDVKQKAEQIQNSLTESEHEKVYKWLETTNPSYIHNRSQKLYEPGTASWLLRTPEWPLWIEGKHRCLWIHGIPGAGKSILASHVVDEIEKYCTSSSSESSKLCNAYYYCYFGHNQDESSHFLRWIIGQLCRQSTKVPKDLYNIYKSGKIPTLSQLLSILSSIIEGLKRVYLVLDAVDESMPRVDLLRVIRDLSTDARFSALSLLVTSREYIDIEQVLEVCSVPITMSNQFVEEDIAILIRSTVQSDARYQRWPEDLRREMQDTIPKRAKGMFRWAVCQLDALKRLRPDVSTIRAALSNLPKTLDETYERIFLAIPEDDWLSVQHVFYCTLLQAVQQSTADSLSHDADQLHDFEGLRERCGCLIMVEQEGNLGGGQPKPVHCQRSTVSFAHYTVKEYLQSPRISQKRVGFFALVQERIQKHFGGIAFRQALAIPPYIMPEYDFAGDDEVIDGLLDADFKLYCGFSSMLQINKWPEVISCDSTLMELSEALVNPYRPGFDDLWLLLNILDKEKDLSEDFDLFLDIQPWSIKWCQMPGPNTSIFLGFLLASGFDDTLHLAIAFARKHSMLSALTQRFQITKECYSLFSYGEPRIYDFAGSIPEMVAQWASRQPATFDLILNLISEYGATHFDLSSLLVLYIGSHQHHNCEKSCSLERLLHLGASADGPEGSFVSPLQIAVVSWDFHGVEILLNAGAEPNAVGKNGPGWAAESLMERYNDLHGASSLHIIRHFECTYEGYIKPELRRDETTREKIEARLLESGAVEIEPDSLEPGIDDVSGEGGDSKDYREEDEDWLSHEIDDWCYEFGEEAHISYLEDC